MDGVLVGRAARRTAVRMWLWQCAPAEAFRARALRAGGPENEVTKKHCATVLRMLRREVPADFALTAIKVAAPTTRCMGERGAPCLLGCGQGADSRAHHVPSCSASPPEMACDSSLGSKLRELPQTREQPCTASNTMDLDQYNTKIWATPLQAFQFLVHTGVIKLPRTCCYEWKISTGASCHCLHCRKSVASPAQAFSVGLTVGAEAVVSAAAWHDPWAQASAAGRRAWAEGRAVPRGDAGLVARLRTSCAQTYRSRRCSCMGRRRSEPVAPGPQAARLKGFVRVADGETVLSSLVASA